MPQSKLISCSPITDSAGRHLTWQGSNGLFYKYQVQFEDGTNGDALSSKPRSPWQHGQTYQFEVQEGTRGTMIKKIKSLNSFQGRRGGGGGGGRSPDQEKHIIRQACLKAAVELVTHDKLKYERLLDGAERFEQWVLR